MFTFEYKADCQVGAGFQVSRGWRKGQSEAWLNAVKEKNGLQIAVLIFPFSPLPALEKKAVLPLKTIKNYAEF